ncbi:hypothetical protein V5T82_14110 [Magnetovibrio sp. PR-2]|uniref:hypothetical protein n=1 Tax=Magnetovibrio sp. PR-2 TaxID=3120356 RepID=UPI002FCE4DF2
MHWIGITPKPEEYLGFVYIITNNITGQRYIGKKNYHTVRTDTRVAARKLKRPRKRKQESNWASYTSSSEHVNDDIKEYGKDNFTFEILWQAKTKGGLSYVEANIQHKLDVLTAQLEDGSRAFYNNQIAATKYIPKEFM